MKTKRVFWLIILMILLLPSCQSFTQSFATATPVPPTKTVTPIPPTSTLTPIPLTSTPTPIPSTVAPVFGIGSTIISERDGMVLVYIPDGEFTMGSDTGSGDQKPVHTVDLDAFWIDQTEVTNAMYAKCVDDANTCKQPNNTSSYTHPNYYSNSEFANYPVIYVDWNMAKTYCEWAGRELPTEAEWEKAARGQDAYTYPWGNNAPSNDLLNYNNTVGDTTVVGAYPNGKSNYGALDMAGNVWEWVADWYSNTYYSSSSPSNPLGPDSGQYRVLRGGAWYSNVSDVRSAYRVWSGPADADGYIGFRCSRSP